MRISSGTRSLRSALAFAVLLSGMQIASAQTEYCLSSGTNQITGDANGYHYELWNPQGASNPSDECMTVNSGATFSGRWTNADDYLARRGIFYGTNTGRSWKQRGGLQIYYATTWTPSYVNGGNSSIGVYGWVHRGNNNVGSTAEFYIIENWYQWNHSLDSSAKSLGKIAVNGAVYEVIKTTRENQPTPWGNMNFSQYVSVRQGRGTQNQTPSPAGTFSAGINVGQHFAAWEKLGLDMSGELYEIAFLAEGYKSTGTVSVTPLTFTTQSAPSSITASPATYNLAVDDGTIVNWTLPSDYSDWTGSVVQSSSCNGVIALDMYQGKYLLFGAAPGSCTLTIYSPDGTKSATATVNVTQGAALPRTVEYRALGNKGGEQVYLTRAGKRVSAPRTLTTAFQTFRQTVYGEGDIGIEFVNDDGVANGKAARVDYLSVDGARRETEAQAVNTGSFANNICGGGGYSEWLYCAGAVNYGPLKQDHTIRIRARGTVGGEHIHLLVNGTSVNTGWWLTTAFQEYTVNVSGDGDLNIKYDNDGGSKDVVVDWLKVDSQLPRQAENMQYNTALFANGRCGGGQYSEWMNCNGVIGFGKISDNFN
ncbi:MAG TPA: glycoside hydrolase family 11 protein [Steroidobacteraceae bacterium]|nr:glycoside hydrolase family 11 protein [Steroidobacteraceae bacterium]